MITFSSKDCITEYLTCKCNDKTNLTFERAPEPSDVYWENLNITSF